MLLSEVLNADSYTFSAYSVPTLITMIAVLLLGLFELLRDRLSFVSASFFLVALAIGIWLLGFSSVYSSETEEVALWWSKAAYLGVPFIAPATYLFTVAVLRIYDRYKSVVWLAWALAAVFSALAIATDALVNGVRLYFWGYYTNFGWLGVPFIAFFIGLLIASMAHYRAEYRKAPEGTHKRRIRALMPAFAVGYVAVVDFVAVYGIPLYPFGYLAILGFVALAARAVWTYRLADITPAFAANQIIETMSEALLVLDAQGVLRALNGAAVTLFGHSRQDLLDKPVATTIGGAFFTSGLEHLHLMGTIHDYEMPYTRDDSERILCLSATVMRDQLGQPQATICIVRDITEEKRTQERTRRQNAYLAALHQTSLGLMNRLDLDDLLETILNRAASLFGTTHGYIYVDEPGVGELVARAGTGVFSQTLGYRLKRGEGLAGKIWETGQPMSVNDYSRWSGRAAGLGHIDFHAVVGVPLTSGAQVVGVLGLAYLEEGRGFGTEEIDLLTRFAQLASIALDNARLYNASQQELTERTRAEEAVRQLNETLEGRVAERTGQLQEAVRSREVLLSVVSHDLRNLLSAIKGSTKLLMRIAEPTGDQARQNGQSESRPDPMLNGLGRIDSAVSRMNNLIGELLDFGRGQAGQPLELLRQQTDLVALAQRLAGEHQHYAERHAIRVEAGVPELTGLWDPTRLERVLDNLITNAIKYSPKGGEIIVEVRREECSARPWAVLDVRDQGIGIPEEDLPDIFNWYARAGNVSGRISGTGIGLASARLVVEQHGGTIDVQSKEGEGTTFTVRLPVTFEPLNV